jgi:hypothetical protein
MTPRLQLAGRIAVFELGLAALVAVVVLSIPKPRPAPGFERMVMQQQQEQQTVRWADYTPMLLRAGVVVLVTGALLAGLRTRRQRTTRTIAPLATQESNQESQ